MGNGRWEYVSLNTARAESETKYSPKLTHTELPTDLSIVNNFSIVLLDLAVYVISATGFRPLIQQTFDISLIILLARKLLSLTQTCAQIIEQFGYFPIKPEAIWERSHALSQSLMI